MNPTRRRQEADSLILAEQAYVDQKLTDPIMVSPGTFYQRVQSRIQANRQATVAN